MGTYPFPALEKATDLEIAKTCHNLKLAPTRLMPNNTANPRFCEDSNTMQFVIGAYP